MAREVARHQHRTGHEWADQRVDLEDWLLRTCEIIDKYEPKLIWFDWWIAQPAVHPYLKTFSAYYYNRAAKSGGSAIINYKFHAYPEKAAVLDLERSKMDQIREPFWQTDTAVSTNSADFTCRLTFSMLAKSKRR